MALSGEYSRNDDRDSEFHVPDGRDKSIATSESNWVFDMAFYVKIR